jgi:hypothetical protein
VIIECPCNVFLTTCSHEFYTAEILSTKERISTLCKKINEEIAEETAKAAGKEVSVVEERVIWMDKTSYLLENKYRLLGYVIDYVSLT